MSTNFDLRLSPEMPHLAVLPVRDAARSPAVLAVDSSEATAEVANTITHGLGFLLSLVAAVVLIGQAGHTDTWQFTACVVYVATMIAVYGASTASHAFQHPRVNHFFRMLDQGCIYLYIAGTFTPVAAMFLRDGAGGHYWPPCGRSPPEALPARCFCSTESIAHRWQSRRCWVGCR